MKAHQVEQGECLSSIAYECGFFPDTIWNHPQNAELKRKRNNPNALLLGDIISVPDKRIKEVSIPTNQVHKFRVKNVPAKLRIQFMLQGQPRANALYTLTIDGQLMSEPEARTDSRGFVTCPISPLAKHGKLVLGEGENRDEYSLQLGYLNPVSDLTGAKQRLLNLGYYSGPIDQDLSEETKQAIRTFQASSGLASTGEMDQMTQSKLQQVHDS